MRNLNSLLAATAMGGLAALPQPSLADYVVPGSRAEDFSYTQPRARDYYDRYGAYPCCPAPYYGYDDYYYPYHAYPHYAVPGPFFGFGLGFGGHGHWDDD